MTPFCPLGDVSGRPGGDVALRFCPVVAFDCRRGGVRGLRKALAPPAYSNLRAHVFGGSASAKGLSNRDDQ